MTLDQLVPADHLPRNIDGVIDLSLSHDLAPPLEPASVSIALRVVDAQSSRAAKAGGRRHRPMVQPN